MINRLALTGVALFGLIVLSLANVLWYLHRMTAWADAALKGPHSVVWPGSQQLLIAQYHAIKQTHIVLELSLILIFVVVVALVVRFTPPVALASKRA